MMPRLRAMVTAWVRSLASSLDKIFLTWAFTVSSVMDEVIGNDFVGVAGGDQAKDFDFARGERVIGGMVREFGGDFGRDTLLPSVNGADGVEKFAMQEAFQQVSASAGFEGANDLDVTGVGGEDDETSVGKFGADGAHGVDAVHAGHLQIHEHDVGPMEAK